MAFNTDASWCRVVPATCTPRLPMVPRRGCRSHWPRQGSKIFPPPRRAWNWRRSRCWRAVTQSAVLMELGFLDPWRGRPARDADDGGDSQRKATRSVAEPAGIAEGSAPIVSRVWLGQRPSGSCARARSSAATCRPQPSVSYASRSARSPRCPPQMGFHRRWRWAHPG